MFNREFREFARQKQKQDVWDVGVVFSGGNTTMKAISKLFAEENGRVEGDAVKGEREQGKIGADGKKVAEDVAG